MYHQKTVTILLPLLMLILQTLLTLILLSGCASTLPEDDPKSKKPAIFYAQGTAYLMQKEYTRAADALIKADELDPGNSKIKNNLGMAYYFKGRVEKAIAMLKESIDLDPKNSDARNNLAGIYVTQNKLDKAEEEYLAVLDQLTYEHQFRTYYNLGLVKNKQGERSKAHEYFQKSIKELEDYCPAHSAIGEIEFERGNYESAYNSFYAASKGACYSEPAPQYYQGLSLLKMRNVLKAKEKFEEIITRFPKTEYAIQAKTQLNSPELVTINSKHESSNDNDEKEINNFTKKDKKDKAFSIQGNQNSMNEDHDF
ncbi:MAG: tetratricopeptide repeat protein [Oligoflexia bacterium]|nr:tetratricopeptide repeat protein [Oligoflexia bacterium]MBF0366654.1 tetratricopeptide repeat protein [Oligoflexia bacterium]